MTTDPSQPDGPKKGGSRWAFLAGGAVAVCAVVAVTMLGRARVAKRSTNAPTEKASTAAPESTSTRQAADSGERVDPANPAERVMVSPVVHPPSASSTGKTEERDAVDALHAGDLHKAATLYGKLAQEYPDNAAFVDAARLLSRTEKTAR